MSEPLLLPPPPVDLAPNIWPQLVLYAATILLEAEGEPDEGKLAVAWVVRNRMDARRADPRTVLLAPWQFSCWNDDYLFMRRARLQPVNETAWERCWWAMAGAYWRLIADPTTGANHYLNPELTRQTRPRRDLPAWYDPAKVTARIAGHDFLRL